MVDDTSQLSGNLAIFDLDNTLTIGDTLVPWLVEIAGRRRFAATAVKAGMARLRAPKSADRRTVFKEALQVPLLNGVSVDQAHEAAKAVAPRIRWKTVAPNAFEQHLAKGDRVLVATGAARLAAEHFVTHRFGEHFDIIGTELEVVDDRLTGRLAGANCVREAKAVAVKAWLEANGPFGEIWGYGNKPHDLPMLALVDHPLVI